ncbi:hypothetical protein TL16_g03440, partial [Triparma laevis f. inornata]
CPLCCEEFDLSDLSFYPCKCGYQICMWCWHKIKETESNKCPACRTEYGDDPFEFEELEVDEVMKFERKEREKASRDPPPTTPQKSSLSNMRVIRRNLVYCVGLPANMSQSILASEKWFGQYGKISKIVVNRSQQQGNAKASSCSAYVTFANELDSLCCILCMDGFWLESRAIRCSYGTSKYCSAFIKNVRCSNPECTYLHGLGGDDDSYTKQE